MTGIIWACAATFIAACVPILAKVGTKKTDPALAGSIAGIVLCASIFFYRKDNIMGSSLTALGQRSVIFILLAGLATGLFGICFFKSIHEGYTFQVNSGSSFTMCKAFQPICGTFRLLSARSGSSGQTSPFTKPRPSCSPYS